MEQIHGHAIMNWLCEAGGPLSFAELEARTIARFGRECRFKTCNTEGHTLAELMAVLQERGKVFLENGYYIAQADKMCDHD